jgi:hypothetical protein
MIVLYGAQLGLGDNLGVTIGGCIVVLLAVLTPLLFLNLHIIVSPDNKLTYYYLYKEQSSVDLSNLIKFKYVHPTSRSQGRLNLFNFIDNKDGLANIPANIWWNRYKLEKLIVDAVIKNNIPIDIVTAKRLKITSPIGNSAS